MAMICSRLNSIFEEHLRRPGRWDLPAIDADSAVLVSDESAAITVTSASDAGSPSIASKCTLVHDERAGAVALVCASPAAALDAATFARWVQRFADELDRMREIVGRASSNEVPACFQWV
jgi:hypothetical protein